MAGITALAWAYLAYHSWTMDHMDMGAMAMPGVQQWGPWDLAVVFAMWAVMMVGMMVPSASPVVMLFTRIRNEQPSRGTPGIATALFVLGYLLA